MSNQALWEGELGDAYTERNDVDLTVRARFFHELFEKYPVESLLEVGCNLGANLAVIPVKNAWGVDVNRNALSLLHVRHETLSAGYASGFDLPFKDDCFDCVMTCGVLIHQKPDEVEGMMQEVIRVSSKYVLCMEYADTAFTEIPYRGNAGALFKGPYGSVYVDRYGLRLIETGLLSKELGFDRVTYWLMSRF